MPEIPPRTIACPLSACDTTFTVAELTPCPPALAEAFGMPAAALTMTWQFQEAGRLEQQLRDHLAAHTPEEWVPELVRFREHSVHLNSISWLIAQAVGDVPPGAEQIEGDVDEQLTRLLALAGGGRPWVPSWARIGARPCVTVKCSHCGDPYEHDDFGGLVHHDTVDEALKDVVAAGWVQDGDRLLDQVCAGRLVCTRDGHKWDDGHESVEWTGSDGRVHLATAWWCCTVCREETYERPDLPPPPDPSAPTLFDGPVEAGEQS